MDVYLIVKIYVYLGPIDALKCSCISKLWYEALDYMWEETLEYKQNKHLTLIKGPRVTSNSKIDRNNSIERRLIHEYSLRVYKCSSLHLDTIDSNTIKEHDNVLSSGKILILNGSRDINNTSIYWKHLWFSLYK